MLWAMLVGAAIVCTSCGGSSSSSELPLSAYIAKVHDETGMHPTGAPTVYRRAASWSSQDPDAATEAKRLAAEGFREVVSVQTGSSAGQGVSWAMVLGSDSAAAREEAAEFQEYVNGPNVPAALVKRFSVDGVPSADGYQYQGSDANILFTKGRCVMLVGDDLTTDNEPPVVHAVRAIWARTHGKAGACSG